MNNYCVLCTGKAQKVNKNIQQRIFVKFHNHSPISTILWKVNKRNLTQYITSRKRCSTISRPSQCTLSSNSGCTAAMLEKFINKILLVHQYSTRVSLKTNHVSLELACKRQTEIWIMNGLCCRNYLLEQNMSRPLRFLSHAHNSSKEWILWKKKRSQVLTKDYATHEQ